jgi:diacylglycerol O-acyltransferase / wax synthase
MSKPIPRLDLSWLLIESPSGTTHVGAMLLFKKPAGQRPIVREIMEAYRAYPPTPPVNYGSSWVAARPISERWHR